MERDELERVLRLQRQAFELLLWIGAQAAQHPALLSDESVEALRYAGSCRSWIERMSRFFPAHLRVEEADTDTLAHLLAAFFGTSFRVQELRLRYDADYDEIIPARRRLVSVDSEVRGKKARAKIEASTRNLQMIALEELAIENDIDLSRAQFEALVSRDDLAQSLNLWSYAHELVRRSRFASQGAAVYEMWRSMDAATRTNLGVEDFWKAREVLAHAMGAA